MKLSLFTAAAFLIASIEAATIKFNVISPNSTTVQVNINGVLTKLTAHSSTVPVYSADVEVGSGISYKYVADNVPEKFNRRIPDGPATYNEFFGRPYTLGNLEELPRPLDNGKEWTRADQNPDLFDTNYIPTIFVTGNPEEMNNLVENTPKNKYKVELTFVGKDYIKTFSGVTLSISGAGKSHNPQKQQWRWTLAAGDYIDNRNNFKLRNMEEDPTQMREKLYADCLRAMGTYANQANMVRYFINGEGFGTFNMLDDVKYYSFIRANFYAGNPPSQMGPLYDGASGATWAVSSNKDYSSFKPTKGSPEGSEAIDQVAKAFSETNVKDDASISKFGEIFDIDQFLRFMVMEVLTGSWDGYLMAQTNNGAYKDYTNNKWYYLGQDYDGSFGVNMPVNVLNFSYKDYPSKYPEAVLYNGLLQNEKLKATFESYIADTVKVLFNNETLGRHITEYRKLIAHDLKWDRSIKQRSPGIKFGWTFRDTYENIFRGVDLKESHVGGAEYGLTEWIYKKSQVVAKEFGFTI